MKTIKKNPKTRVSSVNNLQAWVKVSVYYLQHSKSSTVMAWASMAVSGMGAPIFTYDLTHDVAAELI